MAKLLKKSDLVKTQKISIHSGASAYAELRQAVVKQGILKRSYGYYFLFISFVLWTFFFSAYKIFTTPLSWELASWVTLFSFFSVQIGGLMHDAGHRAIFKSPKINDIFGYFLDIWVVLGYGAWNQTHNKHHSQTNREDEDPDIQLPFHSFTSERLASQNGIYKTLSRYQAYIYYPFRSLVSISRRLTSIRYFKKKKKWSMSWEIAIWFSGMFLWFVLPFLIFPLVKAVFVVLSVNLLGGFYMSNIFAPNHKGMPQIAKDVKISFLEHQIMTTRNIYGHWLTDFVFMGLNYQIEHHLFPNCPRNKLSLITPYVKEICRKMNLDFTEVSVLESNRIILSELNKIASSSTSGN